MEERCAHTDNTPTAGPPTCPRQSARTGTPSSSMTSMTVRASATLPSALSIRSVTGAVPVGVERHQLGRDPGGHRVVQCAMQDDDPLFEEPLRQRLGPLAVIHD